MLKHRRQNVHFTAGQATLDGYLKPGEEIRTPLMTFLSFNRCPGYKVTEMLRAQLWRRWLIDCNMKLCKRGLVPAALCRKHFLDLR